MPESGATGAVSHGPLHHVNESPVNLLHNHGIIYSHARSFRKGLVSGNMPAAAVAGYCSFPASGCPVLVGSFVRSFAYRHINKIVVVA